MGQHCIACHFGRVVERKDIKDFVVEISVQQKVLLFRKLKR